MWLLHRRIAFPGCCQPPENFDPPPRLSRGYGSLCWECFLHWLTWFLGADCGCGLSSCASIALGITSISRFLWLGQLGVFGTPVVPPPASPLPGCVPLPGVSQPRLLVRRLGRRVGCSSGPRCRFRPLGLPTGVSIHKRQVAAGHPARSPPLSVVSARPYSRGILRQRHCGGVYPQGRRHQVSFAEHHSSGDPALVGVSSHPSGSTVYPGLQQRLGGRSVSPSPAASFRVVPQHDRISIFMSSVAGPNRFVCDLRQSSLLDLFFSLPRSSVGGHGRLPPVLGRSTGLRLSSVCHHSQSPRETPGISGDGAHPCGSTLGSAPLVSGSPPAVAGTSGHPSRSSRPPAPA